MNYKLHEIIPSRHAIKDHECTECGHTICKDSFYAAISVKVGESEEFNTLKLHHECFGEYMKRYAWICDADTSASFKEEKATTSVEKVGFEKLLEALNFFHKRWQVEISNDAMDRWRLLQEENEEFLQAVSMTRHLNSENNKANVLEELADQLGVVLGNILWAHANIDDKISIYGVMDYLAKKLMTRSKFGYKVFNKFNKATKMTHWQKVLKFLDSARDQWDVLSGPKHIHPEIRELLTQQEIEKLEKTGV